MLENKRERERAREMCGRFDLVEKMTCQIRSWQSGPRLDVVTQTVREALADRPLGQRKMSSLFLYI